jgi:hypothetical protein
MSLENAMKNERSNTGKVLLKVTVSDNNQVKWPMMFIYISTPTISVRTFTLKRKKTKIFEYNIEFG